MMVIESEALSPSLSVTVTVNTKVSDCGFAGMLKLALSLSGDTSSAAGLTAGNMQFARQLGATHVVFSDEAGKMVPNEEGFWHEGDLRAVRERVEAGGLELAAIHMGNVWMGTGARAGSYISAWKLEEGRWGRS